MEGRDLRNILAGVPVIPYKQLIVWIGSSQVRVSPTSQGFYRHGRVSSSKLDTAWERDWRAVYTACSMVARSGPLEVVIDHSLRAMTLEGVNSFMAWYLPHFLINPDGAGKLLKALSAKGRDSLMIATVPLVWPPHMARSYRVLFPQECFWLLHQLDEDGATCRRNYHAMTASHRACVNSFLSINRASHLPVSGQEKARADFEERITAPVVETNPTVLRLWKAASGKLGARHKALSQNELWSHLSLSFSSTYEKTRKESGKYGEYLEEVQPWIKGSADAEFGHLPDGDVWDCFGRLLFIKAGRPVGSVGEFLAGNQSSELGNLMCLWSTGVFTLMATAPGQELVSTSGVPLFSSSARAQAFVPGKMFVRMRTFTIPELGTKWRPANCSEFRYAICAMTLRHVVEACLKTDNRVALGCVFWTFKTQCDRHLTRLRVRAHLDHPGETWKLRSEDLSAATDLLRRDGLEAQTEGYFACWPEGSFMRRLMPSLAVPTHEITSDEEGTPSRFTTVGTCLGDSCSMFELTLHQLVKMELASILYNAGTTIDALVAMPPTDDELAVMIGDYPDPYVGSCLGDDLVLVGPTPLVSQIDRIALHMGDIHSVGKDYTSRPITPETPAIGIYLEEMFIISALANGGLAISVDNTLKMRLVTDVGPPAGPTGIARSTEPTFGRLMGTYAMLKWQEDTPFYNIAVKVIWENFPRLKDFPDYPVTGPCNLGGLGLASFGGYHDQLGCCPDWYRFLIYHADTNPNFRWALRNSSPIDGHQVRRANAIFQIVIPEPVFTSQAEAVAALIATGEENFSEACIAEMTATVTNRDGTNSRPNGRLIGIGLGRPETGLVSGWQLRAVLMNALGQEALFTGTAEKGTFVPFTLREWSHHWDTVVTAFELEDVVMSPLTFFGKFPSLWSLNAIPDLLSGQCFYLRSDPAIQKLLACQKRIRFPSHAVMEHGLVGVEPTPYYG